MFENIKIIIADDHPLMKKGLKDIIEDQGEWEVVGEADDGEQALRLIEELDAGVLIIDVDMPKLNGLEVAKTVQSKKYDISIIILTMYDKENIFNRALDLGVMGYVLKDSAATEIIDAVKNVSSGKHFISPSISGFLVKRGQYQTSGADAAGISKLTAAERKILKMISKSMTTKEIAQELFISVRTVETHRSNICQKLNISGTNALLHFALGHRNIL